MKSWFPKAALGLAVILGLMIMIPASTSAYTKWKMERILQNARSIHLATLSLMNDGSPGDLKARGLIKNVGDFAEILVRKGQLKPNDLGIFSGPGFKPYRGRLDANGHLEPPFTDENCAYRIYLVRESDPGSAVFLTSKPLPKSKMQIVVRKGGDASIYKLPVGGKTEILENCLNP